eukprot:CAMPEP_0185700890 /NCGR_PEP_ID=MMETSP1164-20130828/7911_1 /TAXON_ID=1104430 /ORGANISM="Chrysoreinhardia sp, Strain CCMP2950" /LENGTH=221 /DNA_ID=CAMNT_0028367847 /DNA_START=33 /DNA_END=699 /DNA_ORIENTATION=-
MSATPVTIRTRKFIRNALLARKQFIVDIIHPGRANVAKSELAEMIAKSHKVSDVQLISLFGFRNKFGGGKSTGFCLIYDNMEAAKKYEPKYRQIRNGIKEKKESSRKQIKEAKNRKKKIRGTGRRIANHKAKKAAKDGKSDARDWSSSGCRVVVREVHPDDDDPGKRQRGVSEEDGRTEERPHVTRLLPWWGLSSGLSDDRPTEADGRAQRIPSGVLIVLV